MLALCPGPAPTIMAIEERTSGLKSSVCLSTLPLQQTTHMHTYAHTHRGKHCKLLAVSKTNTLRACCKQRSEWCIFTNYFKWTGYSFMNK